MTSLHTTREISFEPSGGGGRPAWLIASIETFDRSQLLPKFVARGIARLVEVCPRMETRPNKAILKKDMRKAGRDIILSCIKVLAVNEVDEWRCRIKSDQTGGLYKGPRPALRGVLNGMHYHDSALTDRSGKNSEIYTKISIEP